MKNSMSINTDSILRKRAIFLYIIFHRVKYVLFLHLFHQTPKKSAHTNRKLHLDIKMVYQST